MQHSDIKQLLDAWSDVLMRQRASLDRDDPADQSANIAVDGMSWGAVFHQCVEADLKLKAIQLDFGVLETAYGNDAKKLWALQARRVQEAKKRYSLE